MTEQQHLNCDEIKALLPHRYPMLLVDKVIAIEPDKSIKTVKNVSFNEPYFSGHFPEKPIMPGVLILEALAQSAGILICYENYKIDPKNWEKNRELFLFAGVDKTRFKGMVQPGDQLVMEVELTKTKANISRFETKAYVDAKMVCTAELMIAKTK